MENETESNAAAESCSFCGKAADDVLHLIQGPGVNICDTCVGLCRDLVAQNLPVTSDTAATQADAAGGGDQRPTADKGPEKSEAPACSFCGKSHTEVGMLITAPPNNICNECVDLCGELVKEFKSRE